MVVGLVDRLFCLIISLCRMALLFQGLDRRVINAPCSSGLFLLWSPINMPPRGVLGAGARNWLGIRFGYWVKRAPEKHNVQASFDFFPD